jgi:hypothetical protein
MHKKLFWFWCFFLGGGLVLFAGLAAGLLAGVSTQFIQCAECRSAVKVSTCNNPPPQQKMGLHMSILAWGPKSAAKTASQNV